MSKIEISVLLEVGFLLLVLLLLDIFTPIHPIYYILGAMWYSVTYTRRSIEQINKRVDKWD